MRFDQLPSEIFRYWIESHEDRSQNISVFRPSDYEFPPSRGRRGFEIKENGQFILHDIGPTDRPIKIIGTFDVESPGKIRVHLEDKRLSSFTLRIVSIEDNGNVLKIERL
jgi:hypothetical protein